jgi:hypothetical protein
MDPKSKLVPLPHPYVGRSLAALIRACAWMAQHLGEPTGAVPASLVAKLLSDLERRISRELCARRRSAVEQGQAAARTGCGTMSPYVFEAGALEGQLRAFLAEPGGR